MCLLRFFLSVLCIFCIAPLDAQKEKCIIGKVMIDSNIGMNIPISYQLNGKMHHVLTNKNGSFIISKIEIDTLYIKIYLPRYRSLTDTIYLKNIDTTYLETYCLQSHIKTLGQIQVKGKKQLITRKTDRMIVHPDVLISNDGASTLEVLEKVPGVTVDINGNISISGKQNVAIFIDDRPINLSVNELANYLRSIPSSSLDQIEIMTTPPSKYDAEGNAGIINIRIKKNSIKGWNSNMNLSYGKGRHMRSNNNVSIGYRIDKVNLFSNIGFAQNNTYQDLTIWRNYFDQISNPSSAFNQRTLLNQRNRSITTRAGIDIYMSKAHTIGMVFSGMHNTSERPTYGNAIIRNSFDSITNYVDAINPIETSLNNYTVNLNHQFKIDTLGQELTANLDFIKYDNQVNQFLTNTISDANRSVLSQSILESDLPSVITIRSAKLDYSKSLRKLGNIEVGMKSGWVETENNAHFYDVNAGIRSTNSDFTNNYNYKELIHAVYVSWSKDIGKFSTQLGLRGEHTRIDGLQFGSSMQKDSNFRMRYTNLFPTAFIHYKHDPSMTHQCILSYSRRIDRPNYKDLNPFTYPLDRFTYYGGNPFIKPSFSSNLTLSYIYKTWLTLEGEFSRSTDIIFETNEQRTGIFYSRPGNFASQISWGVSITASRPITKWWTIQYYAGMFNNAFESAIYTEQINASQLYTVIMPTNQFSFPKGWSFELAGVYQSTVLVGQIRMNPYGSIRAGVAKKIFHDKASVKVNISDIFYTNQFSGEIRNIQNAQAGWNSLMDTRVLTLSFSYRFWKGKVLGQRQSGGAEQEQKRAKSQ